MKHKKKFAVILITILLTLLSTLTASATQPAEIRGYFYFVEPYGPNDYCITTGENYVSDGFIVGCVDQPEKPGLGAHGTFYLTLDGKLSGSCEYNLRTYENDGTARFVTNRCTGDLVGFHMKGVGWSANGLWEGSYHFDP